MPFLKSPRGLLSGFRDCEPKRCMVATPEPVRLTITKASPGLRNGGPPTSLAEHGTKSVFAEKGLFVAVFDSCTSRTFQENTCAIPKNARLSQLNREVRVTGDA